MNSQLPIHYYDIRILIVHGTKQLLSPRETVETLRHIYLHKIEQTVARSGIQNESAAPENSPVIEKADKQSKTSQFL
jgi:hypothetical protein